MSFERRARALRNFASGSFILAMLLGALSLDICPQTQSRFKTWNTENGLPQNSVQAIAQTPEGYIWIATRDGLARFDGIRFKIFQKSNTPELPTNRLWDLFADDYGRLWVFPEASPQLVVYENGAFRALTKGVDYEFDGLADVWNDNGATIFTSGGKDFVYRDGSFTTRPAAVRKREFGVDEAGTVWIDDDRTYYSVKDGVVTSHPREQDNPLVLGKTGAAPPFVSFKIQPTATYKIGQRAYARTGNTFWFFQTIDGKRSFVRLRDGKLDVAQLGGPETFDTTTIVTDRSGNLWLGHLESGLLRVDATSLDVADIRDLKTSFVMPEHGLELYKDHENNLWIGGYDGLQFLKDDPVIDVISKQNGLPTNNVYAVAEDADHSIWFGVWGDHLARYWNGEINLFNLPLVTAITHDTSGRLLVGGIGHIWAKDGEQFHDIDIASFGTGPTGVLPIREISFISTDHAGDLWIGGTDGLLRDRDGTTKRYTIADGLPSETLVAFLETREGAIWVGTTSGLARLDGDRFTSFRKADGLGGEFVRSLYEDREGTLWIGTYDSGVIRYKDGAFRTIAKKDGLYSDGVFCILEDDDGWFWMNSNQGIYRVRRQDLNDFADGRISTITSAGYGPEDGLLNVEGNGGKQPAGLRSSDGRLWFPTAGGLAVIDPTKVHRDERAPDVLIEEIKIDQKETPESDGEIVLEPNQSALEINYTGISFKNAERLRFRYKLEGLDEAWTEAGTRRTAYFSHLPYGEYGFHVIAANRDGVWNDQGATMRVVVSRPFHRTNWFYALVALLVASFVGLIYYARVSQLRSIADARELYARQLLESQERERSRLAMELHDSLGQSLVVIRNRALLGISKKQDDSSMLEQLQEISDASAAALQETREIAHTLHPYQIEALGLSTALHSLVDKFENSSQIEFAVEIDENSSDIPHDIAIAVYRIAQEWLTNVVKHSAASEVSVSLKYDLDKLALMVSDNGVGFDTQSVVKGLGLQGIEERARMIGASLDIVSNPGSGAALKLLVDLH